MSSSSARATKYDYDLICIGGGSGGIACAKRASSLHSRRVLCVERTSQVRRQVFFNLFKFTAPPGCPPAHLGGRRPRTWVAARAPGRVVARFFLIYLNSGSLSYRTSDILLFMRAPHFYNHEYVILWTSWDSLEKGKGRF